MAAVLDFEAAVAVLRRVHVEGGALPPLAHDAGRPTVKMAAELVELLRACERTVTAAARHEGGRTFHLGAREGLEPVYDLPPRDQDRSAGASPVIPATRGGEAEANNFLLIQGLLRVHLLERVPIERLAKDYGFSAARLRTLLLDHLGDCLATLAIEEPAALEPGSPATPAAAARLTRRRGWKP